MRYDLTNGFTTVFLLVTVSLWGLAAVSLRHWDRRGPRLLSAVLIAMSLWTLGDAMRFAAPGVPAILLWDRVRDTGIIFLAPTMFLFVAHYTGKHRWLQRKYVLSLFLISGCFFLLAILNPLSLWRFIESIDPGTPPPVFVEGRGLLWYAFAIYGPALAVASYYLLFKQMAEEERATIYRSQSLLLGIGIFTPILLTSFFLLGLVPYDPTPLGFGVTGVTFTIAIFRYDLLDVRPVARDTIVSTTKNGVLVIDREDTIVDVNEALSEMLGIATEKLVGTPLSSLQPEYPQMLDRLSDVDETTERITIRRDDESRHYDVSVSRIQTATETNAGRVFIFSDVTEFVEQKQKLQQRTAELKRQNERLDQFASVVSHDLRNPLHVASARLELVAQECDSPHLSDVADAHERMERLIEDLLTFARAGSEAIECQQVDLSRLLNQCWTTVESEQATLAVNTEQVIRADPERLRQVLENLLVNAIEHGGPAVSITVGDLENGFYVADDGPGIPEEERDEIFESGYSSTEDGTGFGLAIVREIVTAHGWEIEATNSNEGGARFEITGVEFAE